MGLARNPPAQRWARIGPFNRSWLIHTPKAGLCLSAFVIARDRFDRILVGRPHAHAAWASEGGLPVRHARVLEEDGVWLLPATHLLMEEPPERAARRVARRWVGLRRAVPRFLMVQSHLRPSSRWKRESIYRAGRNHWDLCFVYEVRATLPKLDPPWWSELRFVDKEGLRRLKLGRGHRDVLRLASKRPIRGRAKIGPRM
jgi:ADP-ribose pyrophosphatase YjhB (NUDIX family)